MKLKKGDKVIVIAGKAKGKTGTISRAIPERDMIVIDGVNLTKKHRKPSAQNRSGQIIEIAVPIHVSNVMLVDPKSGKPTRISITRDKDGGRTRTAVKSGQAIK